MATLQVDESDQNLYLQKCDFKLQKSSDGTILSVHHTKTQDNKVIRIRFIKACFIEENSHFIAIDHRGNIFIFNLVKKKFWKLVEKVPNCSVLQNVKDKPLAYAIGTKDGKVLLFEIGKSCAIKQNQFSDSPIRGISFWIPCKFGTKFLIYSATEAMLIDYETFEETHRLDFNEQKILIKHLSFIPNSEKMFALFTNDTLHLWSGASLTTTKVLNPIRIKDRYLKTQQAQSITLNGGEPDDYMDCMIKSVTKDYTKGKIISCSISYDGKYVCIVTIDDYIQILNTITWDVIKMIKLTDASCKATCFYPHYTDMYLFLLTSSFDVVLLDCNSLNVKAIVQRRSSYSMTLSDNGDLLCIILKSGEVNLYSTAVVINSMKSAQVCMDTAKEFKKMPNVKASGMDVELKKALSRGRLLPILSEYGEYPEKYRHLIWCSLLDLPSNENEFVTLLRKGNHPRVLKYDQEYPLKDTAALRHLKRAISCLSHWCKMLGHCDYLPNFVFPFLKIFPNSPMLTFELLATLLLNHCQLWFEFAPLEPLNYLGIIENVLMEFSCNLIKFYKKHNITAKTYAWPLLTTAFSEVLDEHQWHQLWDNVISNQPYYLIFCVVAYNILQAPAITSLETPEAVENFFHDQNIVDIKKLIKRADKLMDKCSDGIHPKRYIRKLSILPKGCYPKLQNYPLEWVELKENEMETLRIERELLDKKLRELEKIEDCLARKLEEGLKQEEHEKRMKEVEKLYSEALAREEERIACQRKMLLCYQKQIRDRKMKVLDLCRESAARRNVNMHENELDSLMRCIERTRLREETDMLFAEENMKMRELNDLCNKYQLDYRCGSEQSCRERFKAALDKLEDERRKLKCELKNLGEEKLCSTDDVRDYLIDRRTCQIEGMLEKIQSDIIKLSKRNNDHKEKKLNDLKSQTSCLELEVQQLIRKLC